MSAAKDLFSEQSGIPRILLFGPPGCGKTALLAAWMQASRKQSAVLGSWLVESTGRWQHLADAYYSGTELPPTSQVQTYIVRFEPLSHDTKVETLSPRRVSSETFSNSVIIHDCPGQELDRCLQDILRQPLPTSAVTCTTPELYRLLQEVDALLVLIPALAAEQELVSTFRVCHRFLSALQLIRSNQRCVGGFPVFLVLSQCDRLARSGDSRLLWESRLSARCEQAYAAFESFLRNAEQLSITANDSGPTTSISCHAPTQEPENAENEVTSTPVEEPLEAAYLPFGKVDLQVYAVATRHPPLSDVTAAEDMPYRVAELFRHVIAAAHAHHRRQSLADRRLHRTVAAIGIILSTMLGLLVVLLLSPPQSPVPSLAEMVAEYRKHEPPVTERLASHRLQLHYRDLQRFHDHADFPALQPELRNFVLDRLREIEDYLALYHRLASTAGPTDCRRRAELAQLQAALQRGTLAIPTDREYKWDDTEVGRWRQKWLEDIKAIEQAVQQLTHLYRDRVRRAQLELDVEDFSGFWRNEATAVLSMPEPPYPLDEPLPKSVALPELGGERGAAVLWFVPYHFENVVGWRLEWFRWRKRLQALRDLADACGLTSGADLPPAPLRLPNSSQTLNPLSDSPRLRWQQLQQHYATYLNEPKLWAWNDFPENSRERLRLHTMRFMRYTGRQLRYHLEQQTQAALTDTPEGWRRVAAALRQPTEAIADWGRLLHLLLRQEDPRLTDPLQQLADFLSRDSFTLELQGVSLLLPPDLALEPPRPSGPLLLKLTMPQGKLEQRFQMMGQPLQEGSHRLYIFQPDKTERLTYRAGDDLRLEVPLQAGQEMLLLVWKGGANGSSAVYQFDCLHKEPRLIRGNGQEEPARGARLQLLVGSVWPVTPPLWEALRAPE